MSSTAPEKTAVAARWEAVSAPHGIASLRHTHWLDQTPRAFEGAPGRWSADAGEVRGTGLPERGDVALAPFETVHEGRLLLRAFFRDGAFALRVYDPEAPGRLSLTGIETFPESEGAWRFAGRFVPASDGEQITVRSVDGHERTVAATGTVAFEIEGTPVELSVSGDDTGFEAVIADATAQDGAYRFRFLPIDLPDADGAVTVDFARAYLPPCAFSDQYVCPLPPAQNRFAFAIPAGERRALHAEA